MLARPKLRGYIDPATAEEFIGELGRLAEWHGEPTDPPRLCRDPDDDYLVALAVKSQADTLVSGDLDLHALQNPGIEVITPRQLLDRRGA